MKDRKNTFFFFRESEQDDDKKCFHCLKYFSLFDLQFLISFPVSNFLYKLCMYKKSQIERKGHTLVRVCDILHYIHMPYKLQKSILCVSIYLFKFSNAFFLYKQLFSHFPRIKIRRSSGKSKVNYL